MARCTERHRGTPFVVSPHDRQPLDSPGPTRPPADEPTTRRNPQPSPSSILCSRCLAARRSRRASRPPHPPRPPRPATTRPATTVAATPRDRHTRDHRCRRTTATTVRATTAVFHDSATTVPPTTTVPTAPSDQRAPQLPHPATDVLRNRPATPAPRPSAATPAPRDQRAPQHPRPATPAPRNPRAATNAPQHARPATNAPRDRCSRRSPCFVGPPRPAPVIDALPVADGSASNVGRRTRSLNVGSRYVLARIGAHNRRIVCAQPGHGDGSSTHRRYVCSRRRLQKTGPGRCSRQSALGGSSPDRCSRYRSPGRALQADDTAQIAATRAATSAWFRCGIRWLSGTDPDAERSLETALSTS